MPTKSQIFNKSHTTSSTTSTTSLIDDLRELSQGNVNHNYYSSLIIRFRVSTD